ncbi:MAG: hypothetical protein ABL995_03180 [Bryobacteraceae bacterium]
MAQATYDDANLILRLYEMRREEKMREARTWFVANYKPKAATDIQKIAPMGTPENARMRMVITYWDMVASFITAGVLHPDLFFASGREMLLVYLRLEGILDEMRAFNKDQNYLKNLELASKQFIDHMNKTSPGAFDALKARVVG